jgi:hypothetical protein
MAANASVVAALNNFSESNATALNNFAASVPPSNAESNEKFAGTAGQLVEFYKGIVDRSQEGSKQ